MVAQSLWPLSASTLWMASVVSEKSFRRFTAITLMWVNNPNHAISTLTDLLTVGLNMSTFHSVALSNHIHTLMSFIFILVQVRCNSIDISHTGMIAHPSTAQHCVTLESDKIPIHTHPHTLHTRERQKSSERKKGRR